MEKSRKNKSRLMNLIFFMVEEKSTAVFLGGGGGAFPSTEMSLDKQMEFFCFFYDNLCTKWSLTLTNCSALNSAAPKCFFTNSTNEDDIIGVVAVSVLW